MSYVIYNFFSHLEAYFVAYKTFRVPEWISKVRNAIMIVDAIPVYSALLPLQKRY